MALVRRMMIDTARLNLSGNNFSPSKAARCAVPNGIMLGAILWDMFFGVGDLVAGVDGLFVHDG